MKSIFSKVRRYPHFRGMIYFSDHGEDPDRHLGHNWENYTYRMSRIPFIVYASEETRQNRPDYFAALKANRDKYWSNDLAYDFMVGFLGITGVPDRNDKFDIGSPNYSLSEDTIRTLHGQRSPVERQEKANQ